MTDLRSALGAPALAAAYVVLTAVGVLTVDDRFPLGLLWAGAGVAEVWLLRQGSRRAWVLSLGALTLVTAALLVPADVPAVVVLGLTAGASVQAAVVAELVRRWCPDLLRAHGAGSVQDLRTLARVVLAALVGTAVAVLPVLLCTAASSVRPADVVVWWGGALTGLLLTGALGHLVWEHAGRSTPLRRSRNAALELVALWLFSAAVLVRFATFEQASTYLVVAPAIWVALRFPTAYAAAHVSLMALICGEITVRGSGPFARIGDPHAAGSTFQSFLLLVLLTALTVAAVRDQRQQALVRVFASAEMFQAMSEAMAEGIVIIGRDGRIQHLNTPARLLVGTLEADEAPESLSVRSVSGEPLSVEQHPSRRAMATGEVIHEEVALTLRDGQERLVDVTATPLSAASDRPDSPGVVVVYRDVTEERRQARQLADFAGVVAHDLRSPLTATQGWLDLAEAAKDDHGALLNALLRARGGVDRMGRLIAELLDQATAEGGELRPEVIVLGGDGGLLAEVAEVVDPGEEADILAVGELPSVQADPDMMLQLFSNLIGNALKYVEPGTAPRVRLTGRAQGDRVRLDLSDNGIGIPEDQRELVFERFHRAHARDERYGGTGLGLSICRTIVERHGGRIVAGPGPAGQGTTFRFDLPGAGTGQPDG